MSNNLLTMQTVVARSGVRNANGRIYTKDALIAGVNTWREEYVQPRRALVYFDATTSLPLLSDAAGIVENVVIEDDHGEVAIRTTLGVLSTPRGHILTELIYNKVSINVTLGGYISHAETVQLSAPFTKIDITHLSITGYGSK